MLPSAGAIFRVAMVGGTPADTLDADDEINFPEVMRNFALYNGLVSLDSELQDHLHGPGRGDDSES